MATLRICISAKMAAKCRYDMALKDTLKKLNTQKSTSRGVLLGMLLKNSYKPNNLSSNMFIAWSSSLIINSMNTVKNL